jgi:lysophospholipase L1-like esterase
LKYLLIRVILISLILACAGFFIRAYFLSDEAALKPSPSPQTQKETRTTVVISAAPTPTPSPSSSPTPKPSLRPAPNKSSYIIAAFGDSMVDTMGENLDYLDKQMMVRYPKTKFKFYNYGIGSQNVIEANGRFNSAFSNKTRNYPPITETKPDIIIVSSFAYNPLFPYDKNAYLNALKEVLDKSKATGAKVYLLAEIAPLKVGFGKGVGGVNWDEDKTRRQVDYILQNLDAAVDLASKTSTPLINAYKASKVDGKYGNKIYVSSHDGIHPSIEGEVFMAEIIAETLKLP